MQQINLYISIMHYSWKNGHTMNKFDFMIDLMFRKFNRTGFSQIPYDAKEHTIMWHIQKLISPCIT